MSFRHPQGEELNELLNLGQPAELEDLFSQTLFGPVISLFDRPKKNLRSQIVQLGFKIANNTNVENMERACGVLEILHAGSLVIDDIQDASSMRRGSPSLHQLYGVPLALNAGNWLYFLPFKYIDEIEGSETHKAKLSRECFQTLLRAHYGQALDVGVRLQSLPQSRVAEVTLSAIELKTGVLTGLALKMGSLLKGEDQRDLEKFGRKLGIALQMFDDIGNLTSQKDLDKRGEDLKNGRLNYLSCVAAMELSPTDYKTYLELVDHTWREPEQIQDWLKSKGVIASARKRAEQHLEETIVLLRKHFPLGEFEFSLLENLGNQLRESYE